MNQLFIIFLISLSTIAHSQLAPNLKCYPSDWTYYYFAYQAKYQISSEALVAQANQQLTAHTNGMNGFVTVQFVVNCKSEKSNYEVLEIDNNYNATKFEASAVSSVLRFVKNLNQWQKAQSNNTPRDYNAFITFKFDNGKITEIIP